MTKTPGRFFRVFVVLIAVTAEAPQAHTRLDAQALSPRVAERSLAFSQLKTAVAGAVSWTQWQGLFDAAAARQPSAPEMPVPVRGMTRDGRPVFNRAIPPAMGPVVRPVPNIKWSTVSQSERYDDIVLKYAARYGLDPRLIKSVMAAESSFREKVVSRAGAQGLMQVMPVTAEEMGVPRELLGDPEHNIRAGAAYLAHLFKRLFKRHGVKDKDYRSAPRWMVEIVLAAYNAGPRFLKRTKVYRVTRAYIAKVLEYYSSTLTALKEWILPKETILTLLPGAPSPCRIQGKDARWRDPALPQASGGLIPEDCSPKTVERLTLALARTPRPADAAPLKGSLEPRQVLRPYGSFD